MFDTYRRLVLVAALPFVPGPVVRAGLGCALSAAYLVVFRELMPYARLESNTLALASGYVVLITYTGALVTLDEYFSSSIDPWLLGLCLVSG